MQNYSQNNEQNIILDYFRGVKKANFLDIGANDGVTLSNTYALALKGWNGVCVEPSPEAYIKLLKAHVDRSLVCVINVAIGEYSGIGKLKHSGSHLGVGDVSLLSTMNEADYNKWSKTTDFEEIEVEVMTIDSLLRISPFQTFKFISIDAEGSDLAILKQMDLTALDCRCICIEYNGDKVQLNEIITYCAGHGLTKLLLRNSENVILAK